MPLRLTGPQAATAVPLLRQVRRVLPTYQPLLLLVMALVLTSTVVTATRDSILRYIGAMTAVDGGIFAASTALYNGVGGVQPDNTVTYGPRIFLENASDLQQTLLTQSTAYRMDTLSEAFVGVVAVYLDSLGQLPCGLNLPLIPSVLPPFFANVTFLNNGGYPTTPITLRNLLEHTSTITEVGFMDFAVTTPTETALMTNDEFVAALFDTYGYAVFNAAARPGQSASFNYSRTNTALATFILNNQLALLQQAQGVAAESVLDLAGFLVNTIFPRIGMSETFVLSRFGRRSNPQYPPNLTTDWLPYVAVQDVSSTGDSVVATRTIHPAFASDYMFYTSTNDLTKYLASVMTPGGIFYAPFSAELASEAVAVRSTAVPYVTHRGLGVFNMSLTGLCAAMTSALGSFVAPYCLFDSTNSPSDTSAYGVFASGAFNQVAMLCFPLADLQPWCSVSEVSYFENTSNVLPTRLLASATAPGATFYNWAVLLSVASLAEFTSVPPTTTSTTSPTTAPPKDDGGPSTKNFGIWVFLGVLATIVVVVAASYVADYFIQPAPPLKIVVPVPTVPAGATADGFNGAVGAVGGGALAMEDGFTVPPALLDGATAPAFPQGPAGWGAAAAPTRLSLDDEEDDATAATTTTTADTTTTTTATTRIDTSTTSAGTSPDGLRRRYRKSFKDADGSMTEGGTSSNSPSGGNDRSTSHSQRRSGDGGSREVPHFDAYI